MKNFTQGSSIPWEKEHKRIKEQRRKPYTTLFISALASCLLKFLDIKGTEQNPPPKIAKWNWYKKIGRKRQGFTDNRENHVT